MCQPAQLPFMNSLHGKSRADYTVRKMEAADCASLSDKGIKKID
jgi:hypothetical protein